MTAKKKSSHNIARDSSGLITKPKIEYAFTDEGLIDWRKLVNDKWLVPNRQRTDETDTSKLEDKDLLILLGGIKELAQIRGYSSVEYDIRSPSLDYVVATCKITWIPNFETEDREITFSAIGDASPHNTQSFAKHFLGPIAENRSFVRCVRNFLRINIVGNDEIPTGKILFQEDVKAENTANPQNLLASVMKEKSVDFEAIRKKLIIENYPNADSFKGIEDIPTNKIFDLITRIKKKA